MARNTVTRNNRQKDLFDIKHPVSRRSFLKGLSAVTAFGATTPLWLDSALKPLLGADNVAPTEKWVPTTCWIGKQDCGMLARVVDGRLVKLEGHPDHPRNRGKLCPKGVAQIMQVYDPYRLKSPMVRLNEKGVSGKWKEVSWDEALTLVGKKISETKAKDPRLLVWQKGRSKSAAAYDNAFPKATGATSLGHGAYCSDCGYRAAEYTIGPSGVLHPDFRYTKYMLSWGWNAANGGGNKFCWLTYNQQFLDARERGMKVVSLDPVASAMGPHKDEWLPNRPGSDLAFFLALANQLVKNSIIDRPYLTNYTNSAFLVKSDGYFLKVSDKEQVWDTTSASAKPFDAAGITPALEGEFTAGTDKVKTAFQVYKETIATYTPDWAANICGLSADSIRKVAQELGQNAMIGSKIVVDGVEVPYRPVSIMAYHIAQQEMGFQAMRAAITAFMLLGAMEAAGGVRVDFTWSEHANFKGLDSVKIKDPPYNLTLKDSKYFPINSANPSMTAKVMLDPAKYGVDYVPEVLILHMSNPIVSHPGEEYLSAYYKKLKFIAVIDPFLSETADLYADVVLPAATIEKYEGPLGVTDQYDDATTLRVPPISPLFKSKGETDIYIDLCEKAGVLFDKGGYIDQLNIALALKDADKMDLKVKPAVRDIFDRWAKSAGIADGVAFFEKNGVQKKGAVAAKKYYGFAVTPPFGGLRHRLYGESLLRYQNDMKAKGAEEIYWRDYVPVPVWRKPTMDTSPSQYDLWLISGKAIEFKQSRTSFNPLVAELNPKQKLRINPETGRAKGISDGDEIWVESQNALSGATKKVKVMVAYVEGIRPDTVFMPHGYGLFVHPKAKGQGPTPNSLFFGGEGYVTNTQDATYQVKVRLYKE